MKKTFFFQLILLVILLVAIGHVAQVSRILDLWSPHMTAIEHYRSQGTMALLERHLGGIPESKREAEIKALQPEFGFYLGYQSIDELNLSKEQRDQLEQEGNLFDLKTFNHYSSSKKVLIGTDKVLVIHNIDMRTEHIESPIKKGLIGNGILVQSILEKHPREEWSSVITQISSSEGIRYRLSALPDLSLSPGQLIELKSGHTVFEANNESELEADIAYTRINDSQIALIQGPIGNDTVSNNQLWGLIAYYMILGLLIGLPIAVWLWPLWRFSGKIKQGCLDYARGDFSQALPLKKAGQLSPLAELLNTMADKVAFSREQTQTFSHAVSHDIRTPLTNLGFSLEVYSRTDNLDKKRRVLNRMKASLTEIKLLQTELDIFSRFDNQVVDIPLTECFLNDFWHEEIESWKDLVTDKKLRFELFESQALCRLNSHYLHRALDNLIKNAIRHGDDQVNVSLHEEEESFYIRVENDGQPITEDDRQRVFQPFVRLEESRNRDSGGAGLGLSIVKAVVDAHNGQIEIKDSALGGACFQIVLPRIP